jgi:hypothetical protein
MPYTARPPRLAAVSLAALTALAALPAAAAGRDFGHLRPVRSEAVLAESVAAAVQLPRTPSDWDAVGRALGKAGQVQPGGVYRVALPRSDLAVTVKSVRVAANFALGSYAAFRPLGDGAMVMGDLVLLDEEVQPVMTRLLGNGLDVTALHNHLNEVSPHVMYLHYTGRGDAVQLAAALRDALGASATPLGPTRPTAPGGPRLDQAALEAILGRSLRAMDNGVLQASVARARPATEMGIELPAAMGVATVLNFQPLGDGAAAITGDFVLTADEVNPVARALRERAVEVTALHNHALGDQPRLFYMHFWATGDARALARALRAALDLTASAPAG